MFPMTRLVTIRMTVEQDYLLLHHQPKYLTQSCLQSSQTYPGGQSVAPPPLILPGRGGGTPPDLSPDPGLASTTERERVRRRTRRMVRRDMSTALSRLATRYPIPHRKTFLDKERCWQNTKSFTDKFQLINLNSNSLWLTLHWYLLQIKQTLGIYIQLRSKSSSTFYWIPVVKYRISNIYVRFKWNDL